MKVLLDTCVLSEIRTPHGDPRVRGCVEAIPDENLFLSAISIGEITKGIHLLPPGRKRLSLERWLATLDQYYASRILPADSQVARLWGEITASSQRRGKMIPALDGLIGATALCHGLRVMSRNVEHFREVGVVLINPWEE